MNYWSDFYNIKLRIHGAIHYNMGELSGPKYSKQQG